MTGQPYIVVRFRWWARALLRLMCYGWRDRWLPPVAACWLLRQAARGLYYAYADDS